MRNALYLVEILATWADPADSDANVAWARGVDERLRPFGSGRTNMNFQGWAEESAGSVRSAVGAHYERLARMKARYDPTNLFRLNQNIAPGG